MKESKFFILLLFLHEVKCIVDLTNNFPQHRDQIEVANDPSFNGLLNRALEILAEEFFKVEFYTYSALS